jgi:hypothetical protein
MRQNSLVTKVVVVILIQLSTLNFVINSAKAQPVPVASEAFDISGMWSALVLEDWYDRLPGAGLGEYTGIPMNAAARQKAETWDASILSQPERQAQPHPAQYSFRGPRPNLSIDRIVDPVTREHIGYSTYGTFGNADRTIWLDGRPHPSDRYGLHQWNGFSTGEWSNGMLVVTTTHMKYGVYQRNGVPASPYAVMTEYWFRNGEYLTMVSHIEDPIYLEEPFVRSQTWIWDPPQVVDQRRAFEPVEEVAMDPGWVPHWPLGTKHLDMANRLGVAVEATTGGAVTIYPEYRETLRQMREEFDRNQAGE